MVGDIKTLLKNRKFIYLWTSQIISQLTIQVMNFLLLVNIFKQTGSAIATSLLWVVYALPAIIIGPLAYVMVDMLDKRKLLVITNLFQAIVILIYAYFAKDSFFVLYIVVFIYSFLNQFYVPAESSTLPSIIKTEDLAYANGLFSLTQQAAIIFGFGFAGVLNRHLGFVPAIYLCGFLMLIGFISVLYLPKIRPKEAIPTKPVRAFIKIFSIAVAGYSFIKDHKEVLFPSLLMVGLQVVLTVIIVNMPQIAHSVVKIDINLTGVYMVVPAGLGAFAASVYVPRLLGRGWRKKRLIDNCLLIFSLFLISLIFVVPKLVLIYRLLITIITFVFAGIAVVGIIVPSQTYIQNVTPEKLRGRVFGNFWFLGMVGTLLPILISGIVTQVFGIKFLLFLLSVILFATYFWSKKNGERLIQKDFVKVMENKNIHL